MNFARTIFLTGFPGFIAERLVSRLAAADTQFFLLVEPRFTDKAMQSIERIAEATKISLENFAVIPGDITKENLGISDEDFAAVAAEVTDVFHLAAIYDLGVPKNAAFAVNVEGTRHVNEAVKKFPHLYRYNYISTCYVAGKREGVIGENELEHDAGFRNHYEETKYLAEVEVEKMKADYPVTIFRPAVVVGDSRTGETAKYDGIYYVIKYYRKFLALTRFVNVGNDKVRLNLVPVDFVVEGIAALSRDDAAVGKTIALADPAPATTEQVCGSIVKALAGKKTAYTPPLGLVQSMLYLPFSPPLSGLPHSGVPYFFLSQKYDTAVADELLAKHDIKCPSFVDYVGTVVDFVKKNPNL